MKNKIIILVTILMMFLISCSTVVDSKGTIVIKNRSDRDLDINISKSLNSNVVYTIENLEDGENDTTEDVSAECSYTITASGRSYYKTEIIYLSNDETEKVIFE